ncbi:MULTISPECIES: hypothetical protein [Vibrio]|uniref:hypothetical protein n=1 Tax=Vibrio TaxID=662 RepID=UPI000B5C21BC|nr:MULTISPECIES: hypothetical protein [Vibrio]HBV76937.1 hypothetical protein [Vibrio sp.]
MKYDSTEEQLFHQRNPSLILCADDFYPYTFHDNDGTPFRAKPDFYCTEWNCWIEFKCHQLNNKKTKLIADTAHQKQIDFKGRDCIKYQLDHGWNHSLYKQAKVQSSLRAFDKRMIVVFKSSTKLSKQSQNKMSNEGMEWFFEDDFHPRLSI